MGKRYGFVRISSVTQQFDRQYKQLKQLDLYKLVECTGSGKNINKELENLLDELQETDELVVISLDRITRNLVRNILIRDELIERGVKITTLDTGKTLEKGKITINDQLLYNLQSLFAEHTRNVILETQEQGIAARKEKLGKSYNSHAVKRIRLLQNKSYRNDVKNKKSSYVCAKWNQSPSTYYRYRKQIIKKDV